MPRRTECPACLEPPPVPGQTVYRCHACGWSIEDGVPASTTDVSPAARDNAQSSRNCEDTPGELALTIPWDCLASSNLRKRYRKGSGNEGWKQYKAAREATRVHAMDQTPGPYPRFASCGVWVRVRFWEPDHRVRDTSNLLKCLLDGLQGVAYTEDRQVCKGTWEDMGVDPDNPRAEVVVVSDGYEDIKDPNTRRTA